MSKIIQNELKLSDAALKRRDDEAYGSIHYRHGFNSGYAFAKEEYQKEVEALKAKLEKATEIIDEGIRMLRRGCDDNKIERQLRTFFVEEPKR